MSKLLVASVVALTALLGCAKEPTAPPALQALSLSSPQSAYGGGPQATIPIRWGETVDHLGGHVGDKLTVTCPPMGPMDKPGGVWGSDVYTDDSSICSSAVHAGRITEKDGGTVTLEVLNGRELYLGSMRNGVQSLSYGSYGRSFVFR